MKTVKTYYPIGDAEMIFESETDDGEYLDTKVTIGGVYICTIEGSKIAEFVNKIWFIINDYRI